MILISALSGISTAIFVVSWLISVKKSAYMMLDIFLTLGTLVPMISGYFAFGGDITYYLFDANWFPLYQSMVDAAADKRTETYMGRNPTYRDFVEALDEYTEDRKNPDYVRLSGWAENRLRKPWCNHYENNVIVRAARAFKLDNGDVIGGMFYAPAGEANDA